MPSGLGVGIGARLHVQGDLNSNAVITATPYKLARMLSVGL